MSVVDRWVKRAFEQADPTRPAVAHGGVSPHLPQLDGGTFLTDGGIETSLIFHDGLDLLRPHGHHAEAVDRGVHQVRHPVIRAGAPGARPARSLRGG